MQSHTNHPQVRLGRDRLGIKSSPSFYFFQNGKLARFLRCFVPISLNLLSHPPLTRRGSVSKRKRKENILNEWQLKC
jgi:hypothetical protein